MPSLTILVHLQNRTYNVLVNNPTPQSPTPFAAPEKHGCLYRLTRFLGYFAVLYVMLVGFIAINETNLVYPTSKYPRGNWNPNFDFQEVTFISKDGTKIVGWYLPFEGATENALLCHGNAENVSQSATHYGLKFQSALNANVFIFDYRGYGKSEGEPFEQGVLEDAEAAMNWLCEKADCQSNDIILVGHSIGGGPAVYLASKHGGKSLFLQRTFSSLVEPAAGQYWFIPVSLIMRNRYPSEERIKNCEVPIHQSHGNLDALVPITSGRKLFDASPAKLKRFYENANSGHWDKLPRAYWHDVKDFLAQVNELPEYKKAIPPTNPEVEESPPTEKAAAIIEPGK